MIIDATVGTLFFGRILWEFIMEQEDSQNGHGGMTLLGKMQGGGERGTSSTTYKYIG
jgi:hypothetical protein